MLTFLLVIENEQLRNKLEEIYDTYHVVMYATAYHILKDHHGAEDMVQNAILKLSNNLDKIKDIHCKKTKSYLVIIIRNLSYDAYNKRKKSKEIALDEIPNLDRDDSVDLEEHVLQLEKSKEMAKLLNALYPPYADILTLRYYYELTIREIAEILDITENNVSVRIHRALSSLKEILEERGAFYE